MPVETTDPGRRTGGQLLDQIAQQQGAIVAHMATTSTRIDALASEVRVAGEACRAASAQCQRCQDDRDRDRTQVATVESARLAALTAASKHPAVWLGLMALAWALAQYLGVAEYLRGGGP